MKDLIESLEQLLWNIKYNRMFTKKDIIKELMDIVASVKEQIK